MSNLGRGVNWSAYQSIANMFLEGGKAKAAGYDTDAKEAETSRVNDMKRITDELERQV